MVEGGDIQLRTARNEAIFRDVNEALRAGHWPGEESAPIAFRCECGQLGCSRLIELTAKEYERIRDHPRRFFVAPDHQVPEAETVIDRRDDYLVVEKREHAGRVAEATDPRS
ncbi:MAG TPA: hypothetical protein VN880_08960 [Solirubrobacteraceae bacterium]|nr:hypothetical protein [Solirubrobacteraceae bacterium]